MRCLAAAPSQCLTGLLDGVAVKGPCLPAFHLDPGGVTKRCDIEGALMLPDAACGQSALALGCWKGRAGWRDLVSKESRAAR